MAKGRSVIVRGKVEATSVSQGNKVGFYSGLLGQSLNSLKPRGIMTFFKSSYGFCMKNEI